MDNVSSVQILQKTCDMGESLINCKENILMYESYCAQAQIYRQYLKNMREEAELFLKQFHEFNDRIFKQAMEILDIAIEEKNSELAEAAFQTIKTMKKAYPGFYEAYHTKLLGGSR